MSSPSTNQEMRQFLRQRISGISTAAEDDILALINREKESLLDELEAQVKPIESRAWSMDALALDTIVMSGNGTDEMKTQRNDMVVDRRAFALIKSIIQAQRAKLTKEDK